MNTSSLDTRSLDLRDLDRRALEAARGPIAQVGPAHLTRPTPCAHWNLGDLLRHLVNENRGFAAAAAGLRVARSLWDGGELGADPHRAYQESAAEVTAAFAVEDIDERPVEIREFGVRSGRSAMAMHFLDCLVHGWDVAVSLGVPYDPDEESVAAALLIASRWADVPGLRGPGAPFAALVPVSDEADGFARLLGLVGRTPTWTPPC
ncbi:TIGR03086 family metal-binding protein [Nocardiopsis sp. Huas11]|uniref:TIGR03086 family metal-binding protein n=1 Tax=Nocardiopsis sp. Huas11 TaxID=2183912 RepID=UPI0018F3A7C8|nr:TIGR03086 family metal-binding protein [Nocardiopsis sp. Huas11]